MGCVLVAAASQLNRIKLPIANITCRHTISVAQTVIIHAFVQAAHFVILICDCMKQVIIAYMICHE